MPKELKEFLGDELRQRAEEEGWEPTSLTRLLMKLLASPPKRSFLSWKRKAIRP